MLRPLFLTLLVLALVGCGSAPKREPDLATEISMAEIAQRVGGQLTYVKDSGKGVVEAPGAQLIAISGLDRALFNGCEYHLARPAVIIDGDLYLSRRFYYRHINGRFGSAAVEREAEAVLASSGPPPLVFASPPPVMAQAGLSGWTVLLDAGHGGKDPGATYGGVTEKSLNSAVAAMVAQGLTALGARVVETRESDAYVSLDDRVSAGQGADLFVSIHANAFKRTDVHGVEVYHQADRPTSGEARKLARYLLESIVGATGARDRGVREDVRGLRVLRKSTMPAVLVEMGYMSNPAELSQLKDPAYQAAIAEAIVTGIEAYAAASGPRSAE